MVRYFFEIKISTTCNFVVQPYTKISIALPLCVHNTIKIDKNKFNNNGKFYLRISFIFVKKTNIANKLNVSKFLNKTKSIGITYLIFS